MTVSPTVEKRLAAVLHVARNHVADSRANEIPHPHPIHSSVIDDARVILAIAKEHGLVVTASEDGLDAAWKEAEAALPEGALISLYKNSLGEPYWAHGYTLPTDGTGVDEQIEGPTPAAALHALAERLRR